VSTRCSASTGSPRSGSAAAIAACFGDRALGDGLEQDVTGREVDVDRCADDAGAASDLGHAGLGIARQCVDGRVQDRGDFRARARPLWLSGIPGHNAARALLDGGHRDVWGA